MNAAETKERTLSFVRCHARAMGFLDGNETPDVGQSMEIAGQCHADAFRKAGEREMAGRCFPDYEKFYKTLKAGRRSGVTRKRKSEFGQLIGK